MNADLAETATGLEARYIGRPKEGDEYLNSIGDLFRCQLGRTDIEKRTVMEEHMAGVSRPTTVSVQVFRMFAFGATFSDAVAMFQGRAS